MSASIIILNGSIRGTDSNSYAVAQKAAKFLSKKFKVETEIITLSQPPKRISTLNKKLEACSGILVVSGTYWNNIGSPLQRFIEIFTPFEQTSTFFGKPVASVITMDSAGGLDVASKIHSSFSGLGCWSPPCSTVVLSRVGLDAVKQTQNKKSDPNEDVWREEDLEILLSNLATASVMPKVKWKAWPHAAFKLKNDAWPETGDLKMGAERFL